jgi:hypothetical protein
MAEEARGATKSIAGYWVDALATGGASIALIAALLFRRTWGDHDLLQNVLLVDLLINAPHFAASYFLLYGGQPRRHPWSAFYVPALLAVYSALALWRIEHHDTTWVVFLNIIMGGYLAWHYTGQAWGMMAVFSNLDAAPFVARERLAIRAGLRLLLAFHLVWFCRFAEPGGVLDRAIGWSLPYIAGVAALSIPLGSWGLIAAARRTGRAPSLRTVIPWLAVHLWYALFLRWGKDALFWVQISHATQYLIFPARVELNRHAARAAALGRAPHPVVHMTVWVVALLLAAAVIKFNDLIPGAVRGVLGTALGKDASDALPTVVLAFINIHHYFTDGAVWKLSDPTTRKELTAHLARSPT